MNYKYSSFIMYTNICLHYILNACNKYLIIFNDIDSFKLASISILISFT